MIMTLSGGRGILPLIAPVLKIVETYASSSYLNMPIQSYLKKIMLIK